MAEQSLKVKTVKGAFWSGIDNVVQFGVTNNQNSYIFSIAFSVKQGYFSFI